eukprot:TRINITY_DN4469_c0_g1_i4.p1 TRINITY_DN4469_c0_g1~~TRINITY_DN4469_c0_g1_i4.p1  ORF type:complete len:467 (+),score=156.04 TRINITY_DN4469_c0_g1_i4:630-2030(+)
MSITPDLIEWLLADQKVCQSWKCLASRLNFGCHLGSLEKHGGGEAGSLRLLLRLWSTAKPASYNVRGLKRVLAAEGLHHMWLWISLMTQNDSPPTPDSLLLSENQSQTLPNRKVSNTSPSPWSSYLYTLPSSKNSDYASSSSYPSTSSDSNSPPPSSDYSRPTSRLSDHNTYSCPTTPTTPRRMVNTQTQFNKDMNSINNPQRNKVKRTHSLNRENEPKLAKLKSPKIVETEIWKKEIYKKVIEEVKEYNDSPKGQRNYRSGSLPNLAEDKYTSKVEIQLGANTVKVAEKKRKQSEHEKEILQLCDDIIAEMKVKKPEEVIPLKIDIDNEPIYDKIKKGSSYKMKDKEPIYDEINAEPVYDKIHRYPVYDKINKYPIYDEIDIVEKKDVIVKDTIETIDTYISVKEVKIVTMPSNSDVKDNKYQKHEHFSQNHYDTPTQTVKRESSKEYFENLVNMLEEAVRDISR